MSSTAGAGAAAPLDTTPDSPPADPARVRSAVEALSQVLRNLPRQEFPGATAPDHGQRVARADDLVTAVAADGHEPAAAVWAVHECVRAGWLIPEVRNEEVEVGAREEIDRNSIVVRAERFFGTRGRVPTVRIPGRMVPRPTFAGPGPVPFDCLLVRTTPAFWERPNEPSGRADGGTAVGPPAPTPARPAQVEELPRMAPGDVPRSEVAPSPQSGSGGPPPRGNGHGPSFPNAGFPHYSRYLPDGYNHSFLTVWPDAERQLRRFQQAVEVANRKLPVGTRLPGELVGWWYRHWAGELMARTDRPAGSAAEVRAVYTFGRTLDRLLSLSTSSPNDPHPRDIEFTFYGRAILRDGGHGNSRPDPLSNIRRDLLEERTGVGMELEPVAFPGRRTAHHILGWRLTAEEFLDWAGFLCADGELTANQLDLLAHIAYCTRGEGDWCRAFGTHGEECRPLGDNLLRRIQDDIVRVSDELRIEVRTVGRAGTFRESLNDVSGWLAAAEAASRSQLMGQPEADMPPYPVPLPRSEVAVAAVLELVREFREGLGLLEAVQQADAAHFPTACRGWLGWLDRAVVRLVRSTGGGEDNLGSAGLQELYRDEVRRHPVCPRTAGFAAVRATLGENAERQVRALTDRGTDLRPTPDAGPEQLTRPTGEPGRSIRVVLQWYREVVNLLESELVARGLWAPEGQGIPGSDPTTGSSSGPTEASHTFSGRVSGGGVGVEEEQPPSPGQPSAERRPAGEAPVDAKPTPTPIKVPQEPPEAVKPEWDAENRVLRFRDWEKRYRMSAKNQVRVLGCFQKAGWPRRIDNPFARVSLNITVRDLNDSLGGDRPITFEMDGTGKGVEWRVVEPAENLS
jgi:hypothetical protein